MADTESRIQERKRLIIRAIFNRSVADHEKISSGIVDYDTKTLLQDINGSPLKVSNEVMKWMTFADTFPDNFEACFGILSKLNEDLAPKSVILGDGLKPSEADLIVFTTIHSFVVGLSPSDRQKVPHVMRWMDYIQNKEQLDGLCEKILLDKSEFEPQLQVSKSVASVEVDSNAKKIVQSTNGAAAAAANLDQLKKTDAVKKASRGKEATQEKKLPETESVEKDKEFSVSLLNIQIGLIRKAWKHPSADSLLVEEIDVGDAKLRQVVSGLAKFYSPDELTNRHVVLITNVKPGKLRDVMSEGLVLCASNEDHSVVEPLLPPEGAKLGEHISFSGIDGKPEDVLNPKKKQLEKIAPHLFTDDKGVATFKGIPFMTSAGPCSSSIPKASIK